MAKIEQRTLGRSPSTIPTITGRDEVLSSSLIETTTSEDIESVLTIKGFVSNSQNSTSSEPIPILGFSFDQDLHKSRPYTRAMERRSGWSAVSSEIHTIGWSCLSGLSLAEVADFCYKSTNLSPRFVE